MLPVAWRCLAFAVLCAYFAAGVALLGEVTDDAFISFRYARNLVDGAGLVFNPGEAVEGYTNFLWTLLMAGGYAAGLDLPRFSQLVACLLAAWVVLQLVGFSRRHFGSEPAPALSGVAALLIATSPLFIHQVGNGLETLLFTALTLASFVSWAEGPRGGPPWRTGALLGLSYLVRPDAGLWLLVFLALDTATAWLDGRRGLRMLQRPFVTGAVFSLIAGLHMLWRLDYYGDWLPNTYYVKVGSNWYWGRYNLALFGPAMGVLTAIALVSGPLLLRSRWALGAALVAGGHLLFILRNGGAGGRYATALLPLVYLLVQETLRHVLLRLRSRGTLPPAVATGVVAAALCALALPAAVHEWQRSREGVAFLEYTTAKNRRAAECLNAVTQPGDSVAVVAAGVLPFYADRPFIDMLGLNDRHIAHAGQHDPSSPMGHQRYDTGYVLSREPRVVMIQSGQDGGVAAVRELLATPAFHERYVEVRLPCKNAHDLVFVDRTRPLRAPAATPRKAS